MAFGMVAMDVLTILLATVLYGGSARIAAETYKYVAPVAGPVVAAVAATLSFLFALLLFVALFHRAFPTPTPGRHKVMKGSAFWGWTLNFVLKRVVYFPPLRSVLFSSNVLRYLSLRALGCKIAFTASMSIDADVMDPCLTTIGPGATLGSRVLVSSHYFEGGDLMLAPVTIGKGVLLSVDTMVAPGCVIKDDSKIHGRSSLSVFCTIGEGATVGACCTLDSKVTIEPGEVVPFHSYRSRRDKKSA